MILLLDNYDSFTWNLYDYLKQHHRTVKVVRNDAITIEGIRTLQPEGIVLSPGPGTPVDAGITMDVIDAFHTQVPILGICLGYQAIGCYFGAELVRSPLPVHGKTSVIDHNGQGLFRNLPTPFRVMRYHSLNITRWPDAIRCTATTTDGQPMALVHRDLPLCGVQFHPESVLTEHGRQIIGNWLSEYCNG